MSKKLDKVIADFKKAVKGDSISLPEELIEVFLEASVPNKRQKRTNKPFFERHVAVAIKKAIIDLGELAPDSDMVLFTAVLKGNPKSYFVPVGDWLGTFESEPEEAIANDDI